MKLKKTRGLVSTILLVLIFVGVLTVARSLGFVSSKIGTRIGYFSSEGWDSWSASYLLLDGVMEKYVHTEDGTITVTIETESGSISLEICDSRGNVLFDQNDLSSGSYMVSAEGRITVRIEADHHKGSFAIED